MSAFPIIPRQRAGTPRLVRALAAIWVLGVLAVVPGGARAATGFGGRGATCPAAERSDHL